MQDGVKAIQIGEAALFFPEGSFPFGQEIAAVNREAGVDGQRGLIGIQGGADAEDLLQVGNRGGGLAEGDPEGKISAQRKTDEITGAFRQETGDIARPPAPSLPSTPRERAPVQMVAFPVVPQVEAEDVVSPPVKKTSRGEDIGGIGASFPAVKQDDQPPRRPPASAGSGNPEDAPRRRHPRSSPARRRSFRSSPRPGAQTAEDGLEVGASGPACGSEHVLPCPPHVRCTKARLGTGLLNLLVAVQGIEPRTLRI